MLWDTVMSEFISKYYVDGTRFAEQQAKEKTNILIQQKERLLTALKQFDFIKTVYPSDANFILVKVEDAPLTYQYLMDNKIIIRDRSKVTLCYNCLRITVGTPEENERLIQALKQL